MGLNFVFGRAFHLILMHLFCYIQCFEVSFQKICFFFSQKLFFQNFDWSNLFFDQLKSCFKIYVSLCLVRLIEPVFRSIENRISAVSKTSFSKVFQLFFSLRLGKVALHIFCRFLPKFLQGFPPSRPVRPLYPSFWFYFHVFVHIFMHLKGIFGPLYFWDFWWFKACFLKLIIGFWWEIFCISSCIISFNMFMHHIVLLVLYFFWLTCSLPLVLFLLFFPFFVLLFLILAPCLGRLELIGFPLSLLCLLLGFSCLGMSVRVKPMRNLIVNVRFGLSVLWFLMRSI